MLCREYGWDISYVESLPIDVANVYYKAAIILRAKDRLHELAIVSYPHMKKEHRDKYHKQVKREAEPLERVQAMSAKEMAKQLGKIHGGFGN